MVYTFFFFKQKTAYEMRISDWSSDVCSSDLLSGTGQGLHPEQIDRDADTGHQKQKAQPGQRYMPGGNSQRGPQENQGNDLGADGDTPAGLYASRSDERRVGNECVSTCRSR